jgi:SAM-dependent methyltransferase
MDASEYRNIFLYEDRHWWYAGLRRLVMDALKTHSRRSGGADFTILDAGCGPGGLLKRLSGGAGRAFGVDMSPLALGFCRERGLRNMAQASVSELPFAGESFDAVISLDVLYHSGVISDVAALVEFKRVLKDDGILILNLPAYDFLSGAHDMLVSTRERYTKKKLNERLSRSGFLVERITYWNSTLFPLVLVVRTAQRVFGKKTAAGKSDVQETWAPLSALFSAMLCVERFLMKLIDMPFGSSVFCVARKNQGPAKARSGAARGAADFYSPLTSLGTPKVRALRLSSDSSSLSPERRVSSAGSSSLNFLYRSIFSAS